MYEEVTQKEFYDKIGPLDVELEVKGPYPYKTLFRVKGNKNIIGYTIERGFAIGDCSYFIENEHLA